MARRLVWVDVFAVRPLAGNPLAVVLDAVGLGDAAMQAVAAEIGLSETVFVLPPDGDAAARLRIFTPARELPMAGHPVVGTAWVLRREGRLAGAGALETGVGPLAVSAEGAAAEMTQAPVSAGPVVDPAPVARRLRRAGRAVAGRPGRGAPACGSSCCRWPERPSWPGRARTRRGSPRSARGAAGSA